MNTSPKGMIGKAPFRLDAEDLETLTDLSIPRRREKLIARLAENFTTEAPRVGRVLANLSHHVAGLRARLAIHRAEAATLQSEIDHHTRTLVALRAPLLKGCFQDGRAATLATGDVSMKRSVGPPQLIIKNPAAVPDDLVLVIRQVNSNAVRAALDEGREIPGVSLEEPAVIEITSPVETITI